VHEQTLLGIGVAFAIGTSMLLVHQVVHGLGRRAGHGAEILPNGANPQSLGTTAQWMTVAGQPMNRRLGRRARARAPLRGHYPALDPWSMLGQRGFPAVAGGDECRFKKTHGP
jgi:hypothetical protein